MNVKISVIVMYIRLLTLTLSLLVELGFKKMNKEVGMRRDTAAKKKS